MVELRPYSDVDRDLTLALESDPAVMTHLGGVTDAADAQRVHDERVEAVARGDLYFTIVPDGTSDPAGIVAIWRTDWQSMPVYELGAMLMPRFHARGVVSRAAEMILEYARAEGITRVDSFPAVANGPSNAVLRKLGFSRLEDCDLDYEGRPLRCAHWVIDLSA